ncbi:MAG: carbamoyl-phosphate synthase large subunit, partial [Clostridiales bacterium]|nr:carbamoyl-phosphate synthase large subunit [Clostridiales bacterium]
VYNDEEMRIVADRGISASMVGQVLIEESVLGWEELELEIIRDNKNQMITVCFIENIDPVGVHTGDSFCSAPMLTISRELQERLQKYAYAIVESIQVIGGTNVQFAHDPKTGRVAVIEINPRTSRSSALASKATGFPIAYVSSLLAAGLTLDELPWWKGGSLADYQPGGDYVVIKFAKWAFSKFKGAVDRLGTQMKAVGEVMSVGKTYKEALQKAIRSLESGRYGLGFANHYGKLRLDELLQLLQTPASERQFILYEALRKGASVEELHRLTAIKPWFLQQMKELVELESEIMTYKGAKLPGDLLRQAKKDGFSDRYLARLLACAEADVRAQRVSLGVSQSWEAIRVSGVPDARYYFSTYHEAQTEPPRPESGKQKVLIIGSGPNRIGQGIEFDYCCVHAAFSLRDMGFETIMVNCNPETVSTDYDTSDKLYFEPLTVEDVLAIWQKEKPLGAIVQFGGQTPLNIAGELESLGVKILGTSTEAIDFAEDRERFRLLMEQLEIPMPESGMAANIEEAAVIADRIGYPLMLRPSYVLGGAGMEVVHDEEMLKKYVASAVGVTPERPILIDRFLSHATETETDAVADGKNVYVPAVMRHIELAGVHSGDSACVIPPIGVSDEHLRTIREYTEKIARELKVVGLMNVQFAITDKVYVLEANPRASRTVPLVSKICNIGMIRLATALIMAPHTGSSVSALDYREAPRKNIPYFGVKEAVFPFNMFPEVDPVLGPEMRSTGEVLGLAKTFGLALFKAVEATQSPLPTSGTVLISVNDSDKDEAVPIARSLAEMGFDLVATTGTCARLQAEGIPCRRALKLTEGFPNLLDDLAEGKINLVINTPDGKGGLTDNSNIRKTAIRLKVPYITTMAAAEAGAQ